VNTQQLREHYAQVRSRLRTPPPRMLAPPASEVEPEAEREVPQGPPVTVSLSVPTTRQRPVTVKLILEAVSNFYLIPVGHLLGGRHAARLVRPRHVAMYLARDLTPLSYPQIGRRFGGRDHTTILHAANKIAGLIHSDPQTASEVADLTAIIRAKVAPRVDLPMANDNAPVREVPFS
jgi:hypothetical protein